MRQVGAFLSLCQVKMINKLLSFYLATFNKFQNRLFAIYCTSFADTFCYTVRLLLLIVYL